MNFRGVIKLSLIVIILLGITFHCYSQNTINGRIIDTKSEGVTFANVLLLSSSDSSLVKGAVTNEAGFYTLTDIQEGGYFIESYMVGYSKSYSPTFNFNSDSKYSLKDIILNEQVEELDEVVVKADKQLYQMEMGKMVINVSSSITSSGQSAIDVLEKSPGVSVNRQNNTFSLGGKSGVIVLLNGKRSRMPLEAVYQLLSSLNAGDIEKIEIMTVPPAKYDADGDAGFINIVMKKGNNVGTNGTLMTDLGYATGPRGGASLNLSHQNEKFSVYGNYSYNYRKRTALWNNYRESANNTESNVSSSESDRNSSRVAQNYGLGFDYYVGKNTIISALMNGYHNQLDQNVLTTSLFNYSISPDTLILLNVLEDEKWNHLMGNINIEHTLKKGHVINANVDYLTYDNANKQTYSNDYYSGDNTFLENEGNRLTKNTPIKIWVTKLDYSGSLSEKVQLEMGVKGTFSNLINDVLYEEKDGENWMPGIDFTNYADLEEDVLAAYSSINVDFSEKTTFNTGLRYEHTRTYLNTVEERGVVDRSYGNFFPTAFISHKFDKNNLVQFSFGRRITRPSFNEMAPWVTFLDPYTYFSGNANILPTFTNSIKGDYSYKSLLISVQYSIDKNVIMRFQPTLDPETNVMVFASDNIDRRKTVAANISFPISVTDWWEIQNNISGDWQVIKTQIEGSEYQRGQAGYQLNTTQTFQLPHKFVVELSGFYISPRINGYFNWLSRGYINVGIQKELGERSTLRLACNDIFETSQYRWGTTSDAEFKFNGNYKFEKRVFQMTYTQKFGNNKVKRRKRSVGSEEEMKRVTN